MTLEAVIVAILACVAVVIGGGALRYRRKRETPPGPPDSSRTDTVARDIITEDLQRRTTEALEKMSEVKEDLEGDDPTGDLADRLNRR